MASVCGTPKPDFYQQDSENIWTTCCKCVQEVLSESQVDPGNIAGIGFDATCSLVVLDDQMRPHSVSPNGEPNQNVVVWMDHRATEQAAVINSQRHPVLSSVGGTISPEMETPKLLWLKQNMSGEWWRRAGAFLDLADFLTWRATGALTRSLCSVVCKWTYEAGGERTGWNESYFRQIGLGDLAEEHWRKIGADVAVPGSSVAGGVSAEAASQLGLAPGTRVGVALLDAHAGGLGLSACKDRPEDITQQLGVICGTSSCFMAVSRQPRPVPGVWGPYWSAMLPQLWLSEGGQSASGSLLQHVIDTHPATASLHSQDNRGLVQERLESLLSDLAQRRGLTDPTRLTADLHVYPDHHGNRSPHADPTLTGMMCGLTLDTSVESLAKLYLATIQAIAYGSRSIVEAMVSGGHTISSAALCGGITKSPLFVQTMADVLGVPVVCPEEPEAVLLGAAMLGAMAAGLTYRQVSEQMGGPGRRVTPRPEHSRYHEAKYAVFRRMHADQLAYRSVMADV